MEFFSELIYFIMCRYKIPKENCKKKNKKHNLNAANVEMTNKKCDRLKKN